MKKQWFCDGLCSAKHTGERPWDKQLSNVGPGTNLGMSWGSDISGVMDEKLGK